MPNRLTNEFLSEVAQHGCGYDCTFAGDVPQAMAAELVVARTALTAVMDLSRHATREHNHGPAPCQFTECPACWRDALTAAIGPWTATIAERAVREGSR